jgi:hypothetical protein
MKAPLIEAIAYKKINLTNKDETHQIMTAEKSGHSNHSLALTIPIPQELNTCRYSDASTVLGCKISDKLPVVGAGATVLG